MKTSTAFIASMSLLLAITPLSAASTAVELMSQAGVFDRQLKPQSALPLYLQVEAMEPDNARLMVCLARQYSYLMTDATSATDKLTLGRKALAYAERAVNLEPTLGDAHLSVAICHGKLLPMPLRGHLPWQAAAHAGHPSEVGGITHRQSICRTSGGTGSGQ
ncbi:hypothetical protein [Verrucomicrobium sp. BvORR106]|uniref:hypothetical protein n=1 Tax=Verrucomicrobium sp. BvORR106 TaxID=1403819 RepID=UPI00068BA605|nr:hypothetical protein [Verrucomicrobium sp. BvORR106]